LRGLERLHSAHFLHCDVKPGNVMIDRLGSVRLVDFGRAIIEGERLTFLLGAPMYMAPEIHTQKTVSAQSDLYSAGLIGLEMLRGCQLVENSSKLNDQELLAIKRDASENLSDYLPRQLVKRQKNLVKTIRGLLEFEPRKRFRSTKEAEIGDNSLRVADQQFAKSSQVVEYEREIGHYLSKLVDPDTERVELPE
jgi:serine/threonine protein kinase